MSICERCKTPNEGQTARLCVLCFAACTHRCCDCTRLTPGRRVAVLRDSQKRPLQCATCGNDRYVTEWPDGVIWPGGLSTGRSGRHGVGG